MGRMVRRVALDFDAPLNKVYEGFVMPLALRSMECPHCENGYSPEGHQIFQQWYGYAEFEGTPVDQNDPEIIAMIERKLGFDGNDPKGSSMQFYQSMFGTNDPKEVVRREIARMAGFWDNQLSHNLEQADVDALVAGGRLMDFTHTFEPGKGWKPRVPAYHPTAEEVNRWSLFGMGHDSINCSIVVRSRCERAGVPVECAVCDGSAEAWRDDEHKAAHDAWTETDPPKGEGWQMWETVTEGSPISPVFETPEALAEWLAPNASTFADQKATRDEWMTMIVGPGWAPSAIMGRNGFVSGVEGMVE